MIKIAKFGGSSVADAEHFKKIKAIVDADPARRCVVVSACGRRCQGDTQVTDLLFGLNREHGTTLVLVSHDQRVAERCGASITLREGKIIEPVE